MKWATEDGQLFYRAADARSDIFAFGAVLYEMSTGRKAFEGKTTASVIAAVLEREPAPISTLCPMVPPAFDRVVKKCLAKAPEERWQSAKDLHDELKWIRESGSQAGVPAPVTIPRKGRERLAWTWAAGATVIVLWLPVFVANRLLQTGREKPGPIRNFTTRKSNFPIEDRLLFPLFHLSMGNC